MNRLNKLVNSLLTRGPQHGHDIPLTLPLILETFIRQWLVAGSIIWLTHKVTETEHQSRHVRRPVSANQQIVHSEGSYHRVDVQIQLLRTKWHEGSKPRAVYIDGLIINSWHSTESLYSKWSLVCADPSASQAVKPPTNLFTVSVL